MSEVKEIISINKKGKTAPALVEESSQKVAADETEYASDLVGQDSLTRFDTSSANNKKRRRNRKRNKPQRRKNNRS